MRGDDGEAKLIADAFQFVCGQTVITGKFDRVVAETLDALQRAGQVFVAELAKRVHLNTNFDVFCHGETLLMKIRTPRGKKIPRGRPVRCNGAVV